MPSKVSEKISPLCSPSSIKSKNLKKLKNLKKKIERREEKKFFRNKQNIENAHLRYIIRKGELLRRYRISAKVLRRINIEMKHPNTMGFYYVTRREKTPLRYFTKNCQDNPNKTTPAIESLVVVYRKDEDGYIKYAGTMHRRCLDPKYADNNIFSLTTHLQTAESRLNKCPVSLVNKEIIEDFNPDKPFRRPYIVSSTNVLWQNDKEKQRNIEDIILKNVFIKNAASAKGKNSDDYSSLCVKNTNTPKKEN